MIIYDLHSNDESSKFDKVGHGVPKGPFLRQILFALCELPLGNSIRKQSIQFHCYADYTQLYLARKPDVTHQLANLES